MEEPGKPIPELDDGLSAQLSRRGLQRVPGWMQGVFALLALFCFVAAINIMGHGLKTVAKVPASEAFLNSLFEYVSHPLAGLCVGILITSLVQSSSFTTSFTVGLVFSGQITLVHAIPIVMGANVGTSVTNLLVSLAHIRRRMEFRRSLGGAIVHDFFNVLSVLLFMPLEVAFGILSRPATAFAEMLKGQSFFSGDPGQFNPVKAAVKPFTKLLDWLLMDVIGMSPTWAGILEAVIAVAVLFAALIVLVKVLQGLMKDRLSGLFSRTLFRHPGISFVVGVLVTASVQSSSVTTSLVVPMVGAGVLNLYQIYPYTLGANIGTTVTAILAALGTANAAALGCALAHLLFNLYGTVVFWPLQWIPISLAKEFAKLASRRRILAGVYVLVIFFILPIAILVVLSFL